MVIDFLIHRFVKNYEQVQDAQVRARYGIFAGVTGILLNLCLFAAKFTAGLLTASIAVTADAFNNLSDAGSSVVTLVGFKMAGMPADNEHPFGHGRIEYLSGLAVSMAILLVGVELLRNSFEKVLHPEVVQFQGAAFVILIVSILVKLWMAYFNRVLSRRLDSSAMRATSMDSLTDAIATAAVFASAVIGHFTGLPVDGWAGLVVALFILYTGVTTARDSLSPLLGQAPDPALVSEIVKTVVAHNNVVGVHDLIIHDYGPGRRIISLHAEVPANANILEIHDEIDVIELELREKFQCDATIHMDPIVTDDETVNSLREQVTQIVKSVDPALSIHDFRMVQGTTHTNLIFEVSTPHRFRLSDAVVAQQIRDRVKQTMGERFYAVLQVEKAYL